MKELIFWVMFVVAWTTVGVIGSAWSAEAKANDLQLYQQKHEQIVQQMQKLQIALIQVDAIIAYITSKEKEKPANGKQQADGVR